MKHLLFKIFGISADESPSLLSHKEELVIDLLGDREMFGLDLIRASEGELKRGTIYVLLSRMEKKGLVAARAIDKTVRVQYQFKGAIHEQMESVRRRLYRRGVPQAKLLKSDGRVHRKKPRMLSDGN